MARPTSDANGVGQAARVIAVPVRLSSGALHIVADQDDAFGPEVPSQPDRLIAAVRPVVDGHRLAAQANAADALNVIQSEARCCLRVLRPALEPFGARSFVVSFPPVTVTSVADGRRLDGLEAGICGDNANGFVS